MLSPRSPASDRELAARLRLRAARDMHCGWACRHWCLTLMSEPSRTPVRLRPEKPQMFGSGRGFDSRHLHVWIRKCLVREQKQHRDPVVGLSGIPVRRGVSFTAAVGRGVAERNRRVDFDECDVPAESRPRWFATRLSRAAQRVDPARFLVVPAPPRWCTSPSAWRGRRGRDLR